MNIQNEEREKKLEDLHHKCVSLMLSVADEASHRDVIMKAKKIKHSALNDGLIQSP